MAVYNFKCEECGARVSLSCSVSKFQQLKQEDFFKNMDCDKCLNKQKFLRVFGNTSSKISKDQQRMLEEIREEARKITEKVKSGDQNMIRQVYGEEV